MGTQEWIECLDQFVFIVLVEHLYNILFPKKEVKYEAYLTKLGGKTEAKKWNFRWFSLQGSTLYYYGNRGVKFLEKAVLSYLGY